MSLPEQRKVQSGDLCECGHPRWWHEEWFDLQRGEPEWFTGSINGCCALRMCPCIMFQEAKDVA